MVSDGLFKGKLSRSCHAFRSERSDPGDPSISYSFRRNTRCCSVQLERKRVERPPTKTRTTWTNQSGHGTCGLSSRLRCQIERERRGGVMRRAGRGGSMPLLCPIQDFQLARRLSTPASCHILLVAVQSVYE